MRVAPSNQTLILAGERVAPRVSARPADTNTNAVLKRSNGIASRPDDIVYVRGNSPPSARYSYADAADTAPDGADAEAAAGPTTAGSAASAANSSSTAATGSQALNTGALVPFATLTARALVTTANRDSYGNSRTANRGVEQYARTQRILAEPEDERYVDVLA